MFIFSGKLSHFAGTLLLFSYLTVTYRVHIIISSSTVIPLVGNFFFFDLT